MYDRNVSAYFFWWESIARRKTIDHMSKSFCHPLAVGIWRWVTSQKHTPFDIIIFWLSFVSFAILSTEWMHDNESDVWSFSIISWLLLATISRPPSARPFRSRRRGQFFWGGKILVWKRKSVGSSALPRPRWRCLLEHTICIKNLNHCSNAFLSVVLYKSLMAQSKHVYKLSHFSVAYLSCFKLLCNY